MVNKIGVKSNELKPFIMAKGRRIFEYLLLDC